MENGGSGQSMKPPDGDRESLCFSGTGAGMVVHPGNKEFHQQQQRLYSSSESSAIEAMVQLKARLRNVGVNDFWEQLTRGMASITGSQYAFVSKRIATEDANVAIEMPPIGMPGSCLMGLAIYITDGAEVDVVSRNFKYHAYQCPCAYMRHDKIFVIADHFDDFIVDNPNTLPIPGDSYIGLPLYLQGKCVGHFGVMWSPEGSKNRPLGFGHIELLLHSLEDMILSRLLDGKDFADRAVEALQCGHAKVIPHEAISVTQSLKPYARSLSHELRTPMQGVVGMLDVMYATVQDAVLEHRDPKIRKVLHGLKENIEVVQDSSRRAVEAADNVVHAYDMNMGVPDTPRSPFDEDLDSHRPSIASLPDQRPDIVVAGNNMHLNLRSNKRKRDDVPWDFGSSTKFHVPNSPNSRRGSKRESCCETKHSDGGYTRAFMDAVNAATAPDSIINTDAQAYTSPKSEPSSPIFATERNVVPGLRHANLSDVLQYVVNDSLKVGGRPESAIARETAQGEIIEVRTRSPSGEEKVKIIEWSVDANVPESMLIDERDLGKMISCIVLNAIKFTEQGKITIKGRLSRKNRYVTVVVTDTGSGIPDAFLPKLFTAFSREDDSLTRQSEGLGLGLMVAKGLARKLGGDLRCVHSATSGSDRGTEFEMRVPLTPNDICSRPGSPSIGSPSPATRSRTPVDSEERIQAPGLHIAAARALKELGQERRLDQIGLQPLPQTSNPPNVHLKATIRDSSPTRRHGSPFHRRASTKNTPSGHALAQRHPLNFLVVEDNKINRTILVNMLKKFGYTSIQEAYDGVDAVRKMTEDTKNGRAIDVILMDLWMPLMDGYEATERILQMNDPDAPTKPPTILAVTADVTDGALERAAKVGMKGFMSKPYKMLDLEKLIVEYCARQTIVA